MQLRIFGLLRALPQRLFTSRGASVLELTHLVDGGNMREVTLRIDNMHCGACVRRVSQALERVEGVRLGEVRVGAARVEAPENVTEAMLLGAIGKAGYPAIVEQ
jgi:copper chaperone